MKQTISIATLLALTFAVDPSDFFKRRPMSLIDEQVVRDIDAYDYESIERPWCRHGAKAFDNYCHGRVNAFRYADYRDPETGECDYEDDIPAQIHCLAQQCMYDYCMWRRDEFIQSCDGFVDSWTEAVETVGCKIRREDGRCVMLNEEYDFEVREGATQSY